MDGPGRLLNPSRAHNPHPTTKRSRRLLNKPTTHRPSSRGLSSTETVKVSSVTRSSVLPARKQPVPTLTKGRRGQRTRTAKGILKPFKCICRQCLFPGSSESSGGEGERGIVPRRKRRRVGPEKKIQRPSVTTTNCTQATVKVEQEQERGDQDNPNNSDCVILSESEVNRYPSISDPKLNIPDQNICVHTISSDSDSSEFDWELQLSEDTDPISISATPPKPKSPVPVEKENLLSITLAQSPPPYALELLKHLLTVVNEATLDTQPEYSILETDSAKKFQASHLDGILSITEGVEDVSHLTAIKYTDIPMQQIGKTTEDCPDKRPPKDPLGDIPNSNSTIVSTTVGENDKLALNSATESATVPEIPTETLVMNVSLDEALGIIPSIKGSTLSINTFVNFNEGVSSDVQLTDMITDCNIYESTVNIGVGVASSTKASRKPPPRYSPVSEAEELVEESHLLAHPLPCTTAHSKLPLHHQLVTTQASLQIDIGDKPPTTLLHDQLETNKDFATRVHYSPPVPNNDCQPEVIQPVLISQQHQMVNYNSYDVVLQPQSQEKPLPAPNKCPGHSYSRTTVAHATRRPTHQTRDYSRLRAHHRNIRLQRSYAAPDGDPVVYGYNHCPQRQKLRDMPEVYIPPHHTCPPAYQQTGNYVELPNPALQERLYFHPATNPHPEFQQLPQFQQQRHYQHVQPQQQHQYRSQQHLTAHQHRQQTPRFSVDESVQPVKGLSHAFAAEEQIDEADRDLVFRTFGPDNARRCSYMFPPYPEPIPVTSLCDPSTDPATAKSTSLSNSSFSGQSQGNLSDVYKPEDVLEESERTSPLDVDTCSPGFKASAVLCDARAGNTNLPPHVFNPPPPRMPMQQNGTQGVTALVTEVIKYLDRRRDCHISRTAFNHLISAVPRLMEKMSPARTNEILNSNDVWRPSNSNDLFLKEKQCRDYCRKVVKEWGRGTGHDQHLDPLVNSMQASPAYTAATHVPVLMSLSISAHEVVNSTSDDIECPLAVEDVAGDPQCHSLEVCSPNSCAGTIL